MNKNKQLDELFERWENSVPEYKGKFVKDGIIDEVKYNLAEKKVLFIAKEPNDPFPTKTWDFRDIWKEKDEFKNSFSFRIAEWSYGISNNFPPFDDLWHNNPDKLFKAINCIAFMNVKKIGGGGTSEYNDIVKHVKEEYSLIVEEIEIINPDIIILGLSFWAEIKNLIFKDLKWKPSGYGIEIAKWKDSKVIDFYHPSSRNAPSASYSLLQNVICSNKFKEL